MGGKNLPSFLSCLNEYPLMKTYENPRVAPTIFLLSPIDIHFLWPRGKVERSDSFLSSNFHDFTDAKGCKVTCQPASVKLGDNVFMVVPTPDNRKSLEDLQIAVSPRAFQWTVGDIAGKEDEEFGKTSTGFLYAGQAMNCSVTYVKSIYQFQDTNIKYSICGSCTLETSKSIKLCTSYDLATSNLPTFANAVQEKIQFHMFDVLDDLYPQLSLPPYSIPLGAFPPSYSNDQEDLYRKKTIHRGDVSQLTMWLRNVTLKPSSNFRFDKHLVLEQLHSPAGTLYLGNSTRPIDFFDAYKANDPTNNAGFQISVMGIGAVRPLGVNFNLSDIPEVLSLMFNYSYTINGWMMDLAGDDLNQKQIGVTYLCKKTYKQWQSLLKVISVTVGSSSGVFATLFTVLVALARHYDNRPKKGPRKSQVTIDSRQSTLIVTEESDVPFKLLE